MNEPRRGRRAGERGQTLILMVLMLSTFTLLALVAIATGQVLVRRQQAQMIVDAAALAGAQEQAKGMSTIARINEKSLNILNAIVISQWIAVGRRYEDSEGTSAKRMIGLGSDWEKGVLADYQDIFDRLDQSILAVNTVYSQMGRPRNAARRVVAANFGDGSNRLFHDEQPDDQGVVIPITLPSASFRLVELTEPGDYAVGGLRIYRPNSDFWPESCDCCIAPTCYPCCAAKGEMQAAYLLANAYYMIRALGGDHPTYHVGRFYANPRGEDVRFTYSLTVPATGAVFARSSLPDIPPITVIATAKPFGGHLGDRFKKASHIGILERLLVGNPVDGGFVQRDGKEISYTYRAMLVPVHFNDQIQSGVMSGGGSDFLKWVSTLH